MKQHEELLLHLKSYAINDLSNALNISRQTLSKFINHPYHSFYNTDRLRNFYKFFIEHKDHLGTRIIDSISKELNIPYDKIVSQNLEYISDKVGSFDEINALWIISLNPFDLRSYEIAKDMVLNYFTKNIDIFYIVNNWTSNKLLDQFKIVLNDLVFKRKDIKSKLYIIESEIVNYMPHMAFKNPLNSVSEGWILVNINNEDIMAQIPQAYKERLIQNLSIPVRNVINKNEIVLNNKFDDNFTLKFTEKDLF